MKKDTLSVLYIPLEIVEETSLHHVLVSEVSASLQDEGSVNVQHICRNMTQGQIAQNTEIPMRNDFCFYPSLLFYFFSDVLPFLEVVGLYGNFSRPEDAVVGEHHTLGVDQSGTLVDGDPPQPGL